jgi:hypothetical protein
MSSWSPLPLAEQVTSTSEQNEGVIFKISIKVIATNCVRILIMAIGLGDLKSEFRGIFI